MKAQRPRTDRLWRNTQRQRGGTSEKGVYLLSLSQQHWLSGPGPAEGEAASWLPVTLDALLQTVLLTGKPAASVHTVPHLLL